MVEKLEDVAKIRDLLKEALADEEKGIKFYNHLLAAADWYRASFTAAEIRKIRDQESRHAETLKNLISRAEDALKEMPEVPETRVLPPPRFRV